MLEMDLIKEKFLSATSGPIGFRLLSRVDCYPLLDACANEEFNKNLLWHAAPNAFILMPKIDALIRDSDAYKSVTFSTVEKTSGEWIGLAKWSPYKDSFICSHWIHPNYWGSVLAMNMIVTSITLLSQAINREKSYMIILEHNEKSLRIANFLKARLLGDIHLPHEDGSLQKGFEFEVLLSNIRRRNDILML